MDLLAGGGRLGRGGADPLTIEETPVDPLFDAMKLDWRGAGVAMISEKKT